MKKIPIIICCGFLLLISAVTQVFSQVQQAETNVYFSLPQVALVDIEPGMDNSIRFTINSSSEAGESPFLRLPSGKELWINYSSSLSNKRNSRSIMAEITQGNIPEGIQFFLEAANYSGTDGAGQLGQPAGKVKLGSRSRPVITSIGNCFTGNGINNGHRLSFSIEVSDYSKVRSVDETNFVILYTLTDN